MRLLIQVSSRPGCGAAQPAMVALNAVLTVTRNRSERTVRASREATRNPASGNHAAQFRLDQNRVGSSALSAIGKMPQDRPAAARPA